MGSSTSTLKCTVLQLQGRASTILTAVAASVTAATNQYGDIFDSTPRPAADCDCHSIDGLDNNTLGWHPHDFECGWGGGVV